MKEFFGEIKSLFFCYFSLPIFPSELKWKCFFFCDTNEVTFFPAKVGDLVASVYKTIKAKLPLTLRSMSLYLSNKDTEFILFKPVRVSIMIIYLNVGQSLQVFWPCLPFSSSVDT